MQETGKIWMNGELVDWADATVHVGVHGLHYGTGVFEGIRAYETPKGPAVFRLADHLQRLHDSAKLLYMEPPHGRGACAATRARAHERAAGRLHPADRVRVRLARRAHAREPGRDRDHELAVGRLPRRGLPGEGHHREDLVLDARRAERDPARGEGDRDLPELDARDHRGAARRLRRGDPAHRPGLRRGRAGENIFVVKNGRIPHAAALDLDPARHARQRDPDRQDLGYVVEEADIIRTELYLADEVFMTGTAAEVTLCARSTTWRSASAT